MRGMKGREMETKKDYQERKERQAREWSQRSKTSERRPFRPGAGCYCGFRFAT